METSTDISKKIWQEKYQFKEADGSAIDKTLEDTWKRVAKSLATVEKDSAFWEQKFFHALKDSRFLPAGRILSGAGTGRSVTLFNCFVMGEIADDMSGIFSGLREAALTMQQGGGIGYDFSTLRPKGATVHGVGADASGPLSFMNVWDSMCRTIMSAGSRRGAMMATLRCDHPDIEEFIEAKRDPVLLRMFNLSVLITDEFMEAVRNNKAWDLLFKGKIFKTISARELWNKIMRSTYEFAEPGVIFIDRINTLNNLSYCEKISATNPCGEQPLPPYGACLLGSINLAKLVKHPFESDANIDLKELSELVRTSVRMLDNVIDVSRFPLLEQEEEAHKKRRIGLGVTGLADALIMCGARYGSNEAVMLTDSWMKNLRDTAYRESSKLAKEKGAFPLLDIDAYLKSPNLQTLPKEIQENIKECGIRNALLTSIAPTGTISLLADNISSGVEPVFAFDYERTVLMPDGSKSIQPVYDYAYQIYLNLKGEKSLLPDAFVSTQSLRPEDHLVMQSTVQRYIDSSISKTINCPENISFEKFENIYQKAYDLDCKGCTTYRPNKITGSVLSTKTNEMKKETSSVDHEIFNKGDNIIPMSAPLDRPGGLDGKTYKIKWPESNHAIYITLNDIVQGGRRRPFEIFINSKNMEHFAWTVALTRMISAVFRRGGDVSFVVEELKAVFDPRGGAWMDKRYVPSLLAAIGGVIEEHMIDIGFLRDTDNLELEFNKKKQLAYAKESNLGQCSQCGSAGLIRQEGCDLCSSCGYSKCG
jgi:ribonucleoside-diphosphate reductase alpha chain